MSRQLPGSAIPRDMLQTDWLAMHRENQRLIGIIRNLRQIVWEHHSDEVMQPDVCPVCSDKKFKFALDLADTVLSPITSRTPGARARTLPPQALTVSPVLGT
jgi:hypothetical protein